MPQETLRQIEERVRNAPQASPETKRELLRLVGELKDELAALRKAHVEEARSIAGFTQVAAHEATRARKKPDLLQHARDGLRASVAEFEASHPRLAGAVRDLCALLSSTGI